MFGKKLDPRSFVVAVACLAMVTETSGTALGQQGTPPRKSRAKRTPAKKSVAGSTRRPKSGVEEKSAADRIVLRDGKELLGQVDESSPNAALTILARRELVRTTLPDWAKRWEDAERGAKGLSPITLVLHGKKQVPSPPPLAIVPSNDRILLANSRGWSLSRIFGSHLCRLCGTRYDENGVKLR